MKGAVFVKIFVKVYAKQKQKDNKLFKLQQTNANSHLKDHNYK